MITLPTFTSHSFVGSDFSQLYPQICQHVMNFGDHTSPRGMDTYEVLDAHFCLTDPTKGLAVGTGRKLHTAVGCAEALQLIAGESHPTLITDVAPGFKKFMNGGTFLGAYGTRLRHQIPLAIATLRKDLDSRQAMALIYDPVQDSHGASKDVPCTIALQWTVRGGGLNMHVRMRSNDVWLGLPYDVFQFTQLQINMASCLGYDVGRYYHTATSMHAYTNNAEGIMELNSALTPDKRPWKYPVEIGRDWLAYQTSAANILTDSSNMEFGTDAAEWHHGKIKPYVRA